VYAVAAWPTFRKVLVGLLFLPLSVGAFLLAIGQAHLFVPRTIDRYLGDLAEPHLSAAFTFCDDPRLATALSEMAGRLAGNRPYAIRVVHESEVNALALPNGSIYLFSGLLAESESAAEVAGVMAHEMAHVEERHATRQLIQVLGFSYLAAMVLGAGFEEFESAESLGELAGLVIYFQYSRDFEREADLYAARMLRAARIDGRGMVDFFRRRLSPESVERDGQDPREILAEALPDFLRSHPHDRERLAAIEAELAAAADGPAGPASLEALAAERGWKSLRGRCSDINP
jgi:predicted Zn-dependent protease